MTDATTDALQRDEVRRQSVDERVAAGALAQALDVAFRFGYVVMAVMALLWLISGVRSVPAGSQALVLRCGAVVHHQATPGLVLAWPFPIDEVRIIPAAETALQLQVDHLGQIGGARTQGPAVVADGQAVPGLGKRAPRNGQVLTADNGVVAMRATITYHVADPERYAIHVADIPAALRRETARACILQSARTPLDEWLIHGRAEAVTSLTARLNEALARRHLGVRVDRLDVQVDLPRKAKVGFDKAQAALAEASTVVSQARADATREVRTSRSDADRIRRQARAQATDIVAGARQRLASVDAWLSESEAAAGDLRAVAYAKRLVDHFQHLGRLVVLPADDDLRLRTPVR